MHLFTTGVQIGGAAATAPRDPGVDLEGDEDKDDPDRCVSVCV